MIARYHGCNVLAHLLDYATALVAQDGRERGREVLVAYHHICVAHAGGDDPYKHFVVAKLAQAHVLDDERLARLADDGSLDDPVFVKGHDVSQLFAFPALLSRADNDDSSASATGVHDLYCTTFHFVQFVSHDKNCVMASTSAILGRCRRIQLKMGELN
jgi:hypothetical protein